MGRIYGVLIGIFLLATILCVFGQGIAYFLSEYFISIYPIYYLTGLTIFGILLYLGAGLMLLLLFKKQKITSQYTEPISVLLAIAACCAALWSIFVTIMSWG